MAVSRGFRGSTLYVCACILVAATIISYDRYAHADEGGPASIPKEQLRYQQKSFSDWQGILLTDLCVKTRIEAVQAVEAFGKNGYDEEAIGMIVSSLKQREADQYAESACRALRGIGSKAIPSLIELLQHPDSDLRYYSAEYVGGFQTAASQAAPALRRCVTDKSPRVRGGAALALSRISKEDQRSETVAVLIHLLKDETKSVQISAAMGIQELGSDAHAAVPALEDFIRDGLETYQKGYHPQATSLGQQMEALEQAVLALKAIGPPAQQAIPFLESLLTDRMLPGPRITAYAKEAIIAIEGKSKDEE